MCVVKTCLRFDVLRSRFAVLNRGLCLVELTIINLYCEETGVERHERQVFWTALYVVRTSAHMAYVKAG